MYGDIWMNDILMDGWMVMEWESVGGVRWREEGDGVRWEGV